MNRPGSVAARDWKRLRFALAAASTTLGCVDFAGLGSAPEHYGARRTVDSGIEAVDAAGADGGCRSPTVSDIRVTHCGPTACGVRTVRDACGAERSVDCGLACETGKSCKANVCLCEPESNGEFCARFGARCGQLNEWDNCGVLRSLATCGVCASGATCTAERVCNETTLDTATNGTTATLSGAGLDDCGANASESCGASIRVAGGTYSRGETTASPATVSDFQLDKYEVTVGRFRRFVDAWVAGWRPSSGSGKHTHLGSSAGLTNAGGGTESGWNPNWSAYVGAPSSSSAEPSQNGATTYAAWNASLACEPSAPTWTSGSATNEKRAQNCLSWYDLYAFCIWDGGFLPSEAEWEYAAAGGSEERTYPWGRASPTASLAVYGASSVANVGGAPLGRGRWGQVDLAGNVWEWSLDWYRDPLAVPCVDCAELGTGTLRDIRGGSFSLDATYLPAARRLYSNPASRNATIGGRCARTPTGGGCTVEGDAAFCSRLGATCGAKSGLDNCRAARTVASCGACASGFTCNADNVCNFTVPDATTLGTTATMLGPGLSDCGPQSSESCGASLRVTAGSFLRGAGIASPATVSAYRLDKYEVTVGRFRAFLDARIAGWRPSEGAGKHAHLNGGAGLASVGGGYEGGWAGSWTSYLGARGVDGNVPVHPGARTKDEWDTVLRCDSATQTWTPAPGGSERRPVNCLSWYDLYAFCIWDGGFLPSEAEWEYAAAGGAEERAYPWGIATPAASLAVFGGTPIGDVGSRPAGNGRWGHSDLSGNVGERALDSWQVAFAMPCQDCVNVLPAYPVTRGGGSSSPSSIMLASARSSGPAAGRGTGGRCARVP